MTRPKRSLARIDAILAADLTPNEKLVLVVLSRRAQRELTTAATIAAATGLHRVTVQNTLSGLRTKRLLTQHGASRWLVELPALRVHALAGRRGR